jgi:hypothetical protein
LNDYYSTYGRSDKDSGYKLEIEIIIEKGLTLVNYEVTKLLSMFSFYSLKANTKI